MLSINIPVYNIEIYDLVLQLVGQAEKLNVPFELRVYDDGSNQEIKSKNRRVADDLKIIYHELKENVGRAAIRNRMGFDSEYENLLFIDADSKIVSENYLADYLKNSKPNCVLCGGTYYQLEKPMEPEKLLRWTYGVKREAVSAQVRSSKKGFIITSNNFLIEKKVFKNIHFREDIRDYGHEDTVLGYDLFKSGVKILHLDNPVEHKGLESSEEFLEKSKMALKNLSFIQNVLLENKKDFVEQVYFLNRFKATKRLIPIFLLKAFYHFFGKLIERNLMGKNPAMFWFDMYKLSYFATIKKPRTD